MAKYSGPCELVGASSTLTEGAQRLPRSPGDQKVIPPAPPGALGGGGWVVPHTAPALAGAYVPKLTLFHTLETVPTPEKVPVTDLWPFSCA